MRHAGLWLQRLGALAVLGWLLWGLTKEVHATVDRQVLHPPTRQPPIAWRYGCPPMVRLQRFAERVRPALPPGSTVIFASASQGPAAAGSGEFFRFLWASYFLSDFTVIPSFDAAADRGDHWVAFGPPLDSPKLRQVFTDPVGAVYRVEPPPAPAGGPE